MLTSEADEGVSPVVGVILMVAVTVLLSVIVWQFTANVANSAGGSSASIQASVQIEDTSKGTVVNPISSDVKLLVQYEGETVHTYAPGEVGTYKFVPAMPGDKITVLGVKDGKRQVITTHTVQTSTESSTAIAYYKFDGNGSTLVDSSGNENHGTIEKATRHSDENGTYLKFNGNNSTAYVSNLTMAGQNVTEQTVLVRYKIQENTSDIQQLIEHRSPGYEWYLETDGSMPYRMQYHVDSSTAVTSDTYNRGDIHVAAGTYDGETLTLYMDGEKVETRTVNSGILLGELTIGVDSNKASQVIDGNIYEIRLYHEEFTASQVEQTTKIMNSTD